MKVWYWTVTDEYGKVTYEERRHWRCCPDMTKLIKDNVVAFGHRGEHDRRARDINIEIERTEYIMSFCPFCGTPTEAIEERKVNRAWVVRDVVKTVGAYEYTDAITGEMVNE